MTLKIGSPAPAFSLQDQNGKTVSLEDLRGHNVVLYFYPKAMTPGCTVQACGVRDSSARWQALDAVVLGVSPDTPARLKKFEDKEQLNFTLLSDPDHQVAEAYGAWGQKKFMGRDVIGILRSTFIIDREGVLRHVMAKVATKTHHEDVAKLLEQLD